MTSCFQHQIVDVDLQINTFVLFNHLQAIAVQKGVGGAGINSNINISPIYLRKQKCHRTMILENNFFNLAWAKGGGGGGSNPCSSSLHPTNPSQGMVNACKSPANVLLPDGD